MIKQLIYNDISSTKVRLFVRRRMSIKYLLPSTVIDYIEVGFESTISVANADGFVHLAGSWTVR